MDRRNFNPLPPHGGRLGLKMIFDRIRNFNPLPPHGGRRVSARRKDWEQIISIHSLRMEGDSMYKTSQSEICYFNPLPPHGGRPPAEQRKLLHCNFNPLPPHGGRLCRTFIRCHVQNISIHSLRMEGDRASDQKYSWTLDISIHSLRMEGDHSPRK